jgi:hypothetical protein
MPKYVIEREIPGAGNLKPEELQAISQKSCGVLKNMGPQIQWVESFATPDKIYCVYIAPNEKMVREHARADFLPTKSQRSKALSIPQPPNRPCVKALRFSSDSLHFKAGIKQ